MPTVISTAIMRHRQNSGRRTPKDWLVAVPWRFSRNSREQSQGISTQCVDNLLAHDGQRRATNEHHFVLRHFFIDLRCLLWALF